MDSNWNLDECVCVPEEIFGLELEKKKLQDPEASNLLYIFNLQLETTILI